MPPVRSEDLRALADAEFQTSLRYVEMQSEAFPQAAQELDLSPDFVREVLQGEAHVERLRSATVKRRYPLLDLEKMVPRMVDVSYSLRARAKLYLCPFTGVWQETSKSVGTEAYWAQHRDRACIVLQCALVATTGADSAVLFPRERVILYCKSVIAEADLKHRLTFLLPAMGTHAPLLSEHLARAGAPPLVGAVELHSPHFGHYVWNALSAWGQMLPEAAPYIEFYVTWSVNRFIAPVTEIYAGLGAKELVVVDDEAHIVEAICARGAFLVFPKAKFVTQQLAARVLGFARATCAAKPFEAIEGLRARCRLVVVLGLRLGNRQWVNQEEGLIALARAISTTADTCGFILDGLNGDTTLGWSHALMSVSEELDLAARIRAKIKRFAPCVSTVGASMAESLVASEACDFWVAPAGSGLAKYKWLANKPGIVLSNSTVLDWRNGNGWPVRVFEFYRENLIPSVFVDANAVTDIPASGRAGATHANFSVRWQDVMVKAERLLATLPAISDG